MGKLLGGWSDLLVEKGQLLKYTGPSSFLHSFYLVQDVQVWPEEGCGLKRGVV